MNPCCAVIGADAHMRVKVLPEDYPDSRIKWRVVEGAGSFPEGDTGRDVVFRASGAEGETVKLQVDVGDCPGNAPQFTMQTTTMHEVKIYPCVISRLGREPPVTAGKINTMLDEVNVIFRQVGMHFSLGAPVSNIVNNVWSRDGLIDKGVGRRIRNIMSGTDGLEVYFIDGSNADDESWGQWALTGIIISARANAKTMAHELGHACGWPDIFLHRDEQKGTRASSVPNYGVLVKKSWLPLDWNNGTGSRFYPTNFYHSDLVEKLLMRGHGSETKGDIPLGNVEGLPKSGESGPLAIGRSLFMHTSPRST